MPCLKRILAIASLGLAACLGAAGPGLAEDRLKVVATFTILADLVREVGGERAEVTSLVGPDGDTHGFEPSPADAGRVASARLVVANGLGFEGWVERLVKASGGKATLVIASRGVQPLKEAGGHGHGHGHSHDVDPHAFQSVANVMLYVAAIRDALVAADPAGKAGYEERAGAYLRSLDALEAEMRSELAAIPAARRKVITNHDAFGYFAKAYGIAFLAPKGVSTESEVSARDVARIIRQIKAETIPAVFIENVSDPRLMARIAQDTGARLGGKLYSDALSGPDGPAATYLAMMRSNARTLRAALAD